MEIGLGATVVCRGGVEDGSVERLVVAPDSLSITHLVLTEGELLNRDIVVPISSVSEAEPHKVHLALDIFQLKEMPTYSEVDFVTPPVGWSFPLPHALGEIVLPVGQVAEATVDKGKLFVGQEVRCIDGWAGFIHELRTQPISGKVVYVVISKAGNLSNRAVVPLEWVQEIGDAVAIACTLSQLALSQLQEFPHVGCMENEPAASP